MSISILLEPQDFQPVYNEIITVLDSTKKAEPNFQFVIDVNINGLNKSRIKVSPNIEGFGVVDLHKHIEPYITSNLDLSDNRTFKKIEDSFVKYDITLSEEYRLELSYTTVSIDGVNARFNFPSSVHVEVGDKISITNSTDTSYNGIQTVLYNYGSSFTTSKNFSTTATGDFVKADYSNTLIPSGTVFSTEKYANSSVLKWLDVPTFNHDDYVLQVGNIGSFLNTTKELTVKRDSIINLNIFNSISAEIVSLRISTSQGKRFNITNFYQTSTNTTKFLTVSCGVEAINNTIDTKTAVVGLSTIIDINDTYYDVYILNSANISELIRINIDDSCTLYENYQLLYQDSFGSFIPFNFELASKKTFKNRKTNYNKNYGSYNSNSNTYGWTGQDRVSKRLDTKITERYDIQSNWITEKQALQVIELMNSPEVYHVKDGNLLSINIGTSSMVEKKRLTDGMINYKLRFEYSFKNTVQRG